MTTKQKIDFEDALDEDDYGMIIGRDGRLKGLFIPDVMEKEDYIPEEIVQILHRVYGINLDNSVTIH